MSRDPKKYMAPRAPSSEANWSRVQELFGCAGLLPGLEAARAREGEFNNRSINTKDVTHFGTLGDRVARPPTVEALAFIVISAGVAHDFGVRCKDGQCW